MKRTKIESRAATARQRVGRASNDVIRQGIARARVQVLNEHGGEVGEHLRVLRLALNEAEALAWTSEYPHLFFPELAAEKAEATLAWHRRQRALRGGTGELSLAE